MPLKTLSLNKGQRQIFDEGEGNPLLFVHGFPLDHRMWRGQLEEFSREYRVIAPDLCGFGGSDSVPEDAVLTMKQFSDELAEILLALGLDLPVHLIGLSMGGYILGQFQKDHAMRIASLTLCDTKSTADTEEAKENRFKTARVVLEAGSKLLADTMGTKLFAPDTPEAVLEEMRTMVADASPAGIAAASRGMAEREPFTDRLETFRVPTLVIAGEHDTISPPAEMREMANQIPQSEFVEIADAGHMSPLENPQDFNAALRAFLRRVELG
ncbi:MAG: alpha/beta fold hydrolase [Planctomycetaceae bacterium]|nr:alpha/beta fold hydrolase [Planctomycetaceae bacterium]